MAVSILSLWIWCNSDLFIYIILSYLIIFQFFYGFIFVWFTACLYPPWRGCACWRALNFLDLAVSSLSNVFLCIIAALTEELKFDGVWWGGVQFAAVSKEKVELESPMKWWEQREKFVRGMMMILAGFCFHFDILVHIFVGQEKRRKRSAHESQEVVVIVSWMVLFLLRLPPLFVLCILFGFCRKVKKSQTNVVGLTMQVLISNK